MTKKEIKLFALTIIALILSFFFPRLLVFFGCASDSLDAFSADQNETLYLATSRIIRVVQKDGHTVSFASPFYERIDDIEITNDLLMIHSGRNYAICDRNGTVLERGQIPDDQTIDREQEYKNRYRPKVIGETQYQVRSFGGFHWIVEQQDASKMVRYTTSIADGIVWIMEIKSVIDLIICVLIWNVYFIATDRFSKKGSILPLNRESRGSMSIEE